MFNDHTVRRSLRWNSYINNSQKNRRKIKTVLINNYTGRKFSKDSNYNTFRLNK